MLTVIDEYTRECLAIQVARQIRSDDVVQLLADLFVLRGPPEHLRSDNGPEFCGSTRVAGANRSEYALHPTRESLGERLQREL